MDNGGDRVAKSLGSIGVPVYLKNSYFYISLVSRTESYIMLPAVTCPWWALPHLVLWPLTPPVPRA